jgi:hypothetical protein
MAATATWQGIDQAGNDAIFDIGGSGSTINFTQSRTWATPIADSVIPQGQASRERHARMKYTGSYNNVLDVKFWRSDVNVLSPGVSITCGGLGSPGTGLAYATPSTTPNADPAVPTVEPGSPNVSVDASGATRYAPALVSGANRWLRLQLKTTGATPPGNVSSGDPHFQFTLKYTEN